MSGDDRQHDQYGRPIYRDNEVPPVSDMLAVWQGLVVKPGPANRSNSVGGCHPKPPTRPYATCTSGWVRSGNWWLHCADCHDGWADR